MRQSGSLENLRQRCSLGIVSELGQHTQLSIREFPCNHPKGGKRYNSITKIAGAKNENPRYIR
jgi:hypothetical protein